MYKDRLYKIMVFVAILTWGLGIMAGVFLAYQPAVAGYVSVSTKYEFSATHAIGYWILFFAIGFIILQLAMLYNKCMLKFSILNKNTTPKKDD